MTTPALPEPFAWAWHNKVTGAKGVYFEDPKPFGITSHPDYEWTHLYTEDQARATLQSAQPAAAGVSDAEIARAVRPLYADDAAAEMGLPDDTKTARAILALRPQAVPMTGKQARLLSREELAGCCGGCASNSAIETWMRRAIEKFCEVNGITAPAGGEKQA